jgi:hypothetical protein
MGARLVLGLEGAQDPDAMARTIAHQVLNHGGAIDAAIASLLAQNPDAG